MSCQVTSNRAQGRYCTPCPFADDRCFSKGRDHLTVNWKGAWNETATYYENDMVQYRGCLWQARNGHAGIVPQPTPHNAWQNVGPASGPDHLDDPHFAKSGTAVCGGWRVQYPGLHRDVEVADCYDLAQHKRQLTQAFGVPPMAIGPVVSGGLAPPEAEIIPLPLPVVHYDPVTAEKATLHPPNCLCTSCQLYLAKQTVLEAHKQIRQMSREKRELHKDREEMWGIAKASVEETSRLQDQYLRMAKEKREIMPVPDKRVEVRIGDAERNRYIDHLGNMFSDGHLTQEEFDTRMNLATGARHESELRTLVQDLPDMRLSEKPAAGHVMPRKPFLERAVTLPPLFALMSIFALLTLLVVLGVL